jgi:glycerol-3-phosphate acyltransferase PlsX
MPPVRIAVDAMGGDHGPRVVVPGALRAAERLGAGTTLLLVGESARVAAAVHGGGAAAVEVVHAPDEISMHEAAATAVRRKPESSLARALGLLAQGRADAMVSAGSTGAVVAGALLGLGRIGRVLRPALATLFPTETSRCVVVDVGANADCKPQHLVQFAAMGAVYARIHLGCDRPRVGLLNIGEEDSKGNELAIAAHQLLRQSGLHFVGNVEGRDLLAGRADVVVCDGFVGNVVLKFGESMLRFLSRQMRAEVRRSLRAKLGALWLRPAFESLRRRIDYTEEGGAPLLGVRRTVVIAHGKSPERAIQNAVLLGAKLAANALPDQIEARLQELGALDGALPARDGG